MRNGRKPLRDRDRAFEVTSSVGRADAETDDLETLTGQAADEPSSLQLALDSLDPLDEPAEMLIRVSSEALEGDSDLVDDGGNGGDDDEIENLTGHERVADEAGEAPQVAESPVALDLAAEMPAGGLEATPDGIVEAPESPAEPAPEPAEPPVEAGASEVVSEDFVRSAAGVPTDVVEEETDSEAFGMEAEGGFRTAELSAPPLSYEPAESAPLDDPVLQMRLARIHLKTGSLTIARAELEALAARNQLDTPAHLDLAEVRWRTGDLDGAGEAAGAYMDGGGDEALGFVIAAEASAMANRHAEARRHTEQALERQLSELDQVFAGIPRRAMWALPAWGAAAPEAIAAPAVPAAAEQVQSEVAQAEPEAVEQVAIEPDAEAVESAASVEPEFESVESAVDQVATEPEADAVPVELAAEPVELAAEPVELAAEPVELAAEPVELAAESVELEPEPEVEPVELAAEPVELAAEAEAEPPAEEPAVEAAPNDVQATAEVASGCSYLEAGDPMMAALHFGVAIRLAPASATSVLDAIGDRQELPLQLVRGDALRLLGLEGDAGRAYQSVASALGAPKPVRLAPPEPPTQASAEPEAPTASAEPEASAEPIASAEPEAPSKPSVADPPPIRWD